MKDENSGNSSTKRKKALKESDNRMRKHSLLVVDDELFAVRGITEGITWSEIGIHEVKGVCNVREAKEILERESVDIVISDIEMPGENGLELLTWITEHFPKTKVLLLTAYSRFEYAAYALKYQAEDYLLKPVRHEELKQRVKQCLERLEEDEDKERELENLRRAVPLLIEKFWIDILEGRNSVYPERTKELRKYITVPNALEDKLIPVLVTSEMETGMLEMEEIYRQLLQQIQMEEEGILGKTTGVVWEELLFLFICGDSTESELWDLEKKLQEMTGKHQFPLRIFMGQQTALGELSAACESLLICAGESEESEKSYELLYAQKTGAPEDEAEQFPLVVDWIPMLESGKEEAFTIQMQELFQVLNERRGTDRKTLRELYMGLWYSFATAARRNALEGIWNGFLNQDRKVYRSLEELKEWTEKISVGYFSELKKNEKKNYAVKEKVEKYVMEHISEDFKREDIANALYFNPSYLSHIFKAETGISLNKFINQLRIREAKRLFDTTAFSVGTVAMDTGYYNFSYFSKQFKEIYHVTPSEYKKTTGTQ